MTEKSKKNERTPEEQALGTAAHTAGTPEGAIEGEAPVRDPRNTAESSGEKKKLPADDEQQVLEEAVDEGVDQADDDQRFASD